MPRETPYSIASDYATLKAGPYDFYYGYERTDPADEAWCFTAEYHGREVYRVPNTKLRTDDKWDCAKCLLAGIAQFHDVLETIRDAWPEMESRT